MPLYTRSVTDSSTVNFLFGGWPFAHIGEFTLRDGSQYLDIRTNLGDNYMTAAMYFGYLYNRGNCFGFWGGYPYQSTSILNNYISNMVSTTSNAAGQTILTSVYRATAANSYGTCFKFDSKGASYTEGKINLFINTHNGAPSGLTAVAFAQNNNAGNFY